MSNVITTMVSLEEYAEKKEERIPASTTVRIWSGEHSAFWRPDGRGYTVYEADAGLYTLAEAYKRTKHCDESKHIWFCPVPVLRRVVCAANRTAEGVVVLGIRHCDQFMRASGGGLAGAEQGFVDQHGVFLTREEAFVVATEANQIVRRCGGDAERLFSENLY